MAAAAVENRHHDPTGNEIGQEHVDRLRIDQRMVDEKKQRARTIGREGRMPVWNEVIMPCA